MLKNIYENRGAVIFILISALVLSFAFYFGVTQRIDNSAENKTVVLNEETTVQTTVTETVTELTTAVSTETTTETTTLVEIDDTPGTIEVPNLVPEDSGNLEFTTEISSEVTTEGICTFSVNCSTILNNMDKLDKAKVSLVPANGEIYSTADVEVRKGDTVFTLLERELVLKGIHFEYNKTTNVYIEGIGNIYEFDCGELSGWEYKVNGEFPSVGCDEYKIKAGDVIEWVYTCDLGRDVGDSYLGDK